MSKKVTYEADLGSGVSHVAVDDIEIAKGDSEVVSDEQAKRLQDLDGVRIKVENDKPGAASSQND